MLKYRKDGMSVIVVLGRRRKNNCSITLNSSLHLMMDECLKEGKINSYYRCRSTLLNIERFAGRDISFGEVTPQWLKECEKYWLCDGKSLTTVNIYMKL